MESFNISYLIFYTNNKSKIIFLSFIRVPVYYKYYNSFSLIEFISKLDLYILLYYLLLIVYSIFNNTKL